MNTNVRPDSMERITTKALAEKFIELNNHEVYLWNTIKRFLESLSVKVSSLYNVTE